MVEDITSMEVDFAKWYTDVVKKAELVDYSSVKGCMIIRPYGYAIWENIQADLDKNFVSQTSFITRPFDKVIFCIPKEMFRMFLEADEIEKGKVIAVTSPEFKDECESRGWTFLERKGARVGDANADEIERLIRDLCA